MKKTKIMINILLMSLLIISMVSASSVTTNRLNFYSSEEHTINISNTLTESANAVSVMPVGFNFVSSVSGCTNPNGQTINCDNIASNGSAEFIISSPISGTEYNLYKLTTTLNSSDLNDVNFINIREDEIWNTLVEYGRGRGNYFYNSMGTVGSAGTGTGYKYLPNATDFELNYLHKVFNIKQYFGLADSTATDVTFTCNYPYHTVVREHQVSTISNDANDWTVTYSLPRIEGSWERMGFLGMDFDDGDYNVGDNFLINCTNLDYNLADAYGHIMVGEDSFDMEIRSINPVDVSAISDVATIGNGTTEVGITYTITNTELYPLDNLIVEIQSPKDAIFIGVRGELWGTGTDSYRYEIAKLNSGESRNIKLIARFDTNFDSDTTLKLSEGVKSVFIPTWEINAYNPLILLETSNPTETLNVNYSVSSEIINLQSQINKIEVNTIKINDTVNTIEYLVNLLNTTSTNQLLTNLNATLSGTNEILNQLNLTDNTELLIQINNSNNVINDNLLNMNSTLSNLIINQFDNIEEETNNILSELSYMQDFNEELIFLVTDSVGMANEGKDAFDNGDIDTAVKKLDSSKKLLNKANDMLDKEKKPIQHEIKVENSTGFMKIIYWFQSLF